MTTIKSKPLPKMFRRLIAFCGGGTEIVKLELRVRDAAGVVTIFASDDADARKRIELRVFDTTGAVVTYSDDDTLADISMVKSDPADYVTIDRKTLLTLVDYTEANIAVCKEILKRSGALSDAAGILHPEKMVNYIDARGKRAVEMARVALSSHTT